MYIIQPNEQNILFSNVSTIAKAFLCCPQGSIISWLKVKEPVETLERTLSFLPKIIVK